ncbi:hypothetical protein MUB24_16520 [Lederbergia sp. NSJ-179]|uniref:hypothetical protein n=1 Tax=Lederbergia sp. NSJ-179 TaxID=2931402 RepID=UPI001FCF90E7|nr:hypothetical protein [Lederbergia sp. NSJ-179]MCJ7842474.1 hypothetical protein [Lederbergia sp. NSJ-179]
MFLILLNIMILLIVVFFIVKKRLNLLENLFIFMIQEFLITSYFSVLYINLKVWKITESHELFIIFRLYEIITIPLLHLTYFNLLVTIKSRLTKLIFTILFVAILYGVEFLLVKGKVIHYNEWHFWQSLLIISFVLLISYLLQLSFKQVLRKEGI